MNDSEENDLLRDSLNESIRMACDRLKITGVFRSLDGGTQWEVIIKCHSIIEAAINEMISKRLNINESSGIIEKMNMGGRTGKIRLCVEMKLLDHDACGFIECLGELRNKCCHNIFGLNFKLGEYMTSIRDDSKRKQMNNKLNVYIDEKFRNESEFLNNPNNIIITSTKYILATVQLTCEILELRESVNPSYQCDD